MKNALIGSLASLMLMMGWYLYTPQSAWYLPGSYGNDVAPGSMFSMYPSNNSYGSNYGSYGQTSGYQQSYGSYGSGYNYPQQYNSYNPYAHGSPSVYVNVAAPAMYGGYSGGYGGWY